MKGVVLGLALVAASGAAVGGRGADPVDALVARTARYVDEYLRQFSAVVCEERQTQRVIRSDGTLRERRDLVSDLLLVKAGGDTYIFRDVISADGKPVRDRQDRLRQLFLDAPGRAVNQAAAIGRESTRYNIGIPRKGEFLLLPLRILDPQAASGFHFAMTDQGFAFDEFRSPSTILYRERGDLRDMFLRGRFTIDPDGARVRAANFTARNSRFEMTFEVTYVEHPELGLLVPSQSQEQYRMIAKPKEDRLEVSSSLSNFRKFQVTVDEQFGLPR